MPEVGWSPGLFFHFFKLLGDFYQAPPGSQASSRGEAKDSALLSSRDAGLLEPSERLCDPIDGSPPGSSITGILQARTLEWVAISFSNA